MPRLGARGVVIILVLIGVAVFGVVGLQKRLHPMNAVSRDAAIRYIPNRNVLQLSSFGFQQVYADMLWIRAIQYLATPFENPDAKYEWMEEIFQAVTDLDPKFISAYRLGASWLTLLKRDGLAGVRLLEKGMRENPDRWELPHDLAMIYYVDRKDREEALAQLEIAVAKPDCPFHVRTFYSIMVNTDEAWGAIAMWLRYLEQNKSELVQNLAWENICKVQAKILREGVRRFHEERGRNPKDLDELLGAGHVVLRDGFDLREGMAYDPDTGKVRSPKLEDLQVKKAFYLYGKAVELYRERFGRSAESLRDLGKVLRRMPRHPQHREGVRYALDADTGRIQIRRVETEVEAEPPR